LTPRRSKHAYSKFAYKARSLCWKLVRAASREATFATRHGRLTVDTGDRTIARSLFCHGDYELDWMLRTTEHLRSLGQLPAKGTGTILDAGANMGVTSVGMLYNGEFERAVAVEPDPRNFELLQRNMQQNGFAARSVCVHAALSDRLGKLELELSETNFGDHRVRAPGAVPDDGKFGESGRRVLSVDSRTLDDVVAGLPPEFSSSVALLWMDVQGHEGYALTGARKTLAAGIPVATEIWPYGIARAGMAREPFCALVKSLWPYYWMLRGPGRVRRFVRYPSAIFDTVFDEIGPDGAYENVLFTL
jgi:FkbM family methyltransferase